MEYLIIYLIGFVICYYIFRKEERKNRGEYYNWNSVLEVLGISLLSFIALFILVMLYFLYYFKNSKPPKFL